MQWMSAPSSEGALIACTPSSPDDEEVEFLPERRPLKFE